MTNEPSLFELLRLDNTYKNCNKQSKDQDPVFQSVVSLMSPLRVISLTFLADSIFFSKTFQHIYVSLDVNFNKSLTNDVVSFEQLGPEARAEENHKRDNNGPDHKQQQSGSKHLKQIEEVAVIQYDIRHRSDVKSYDRLK